ncbi:MAG: ribonuclease HI family protein [Bdellovibrionales bacterium]
MTQQWPKKVFIYTDGASRGNPGPCALGIYVIDSDRKIIYQEGQYLEASNTNNFAEYQAVIYALQLSVKHKVDNVHLYSDSELLVQQINKKYKVKSPNIKPLFEECQKLLLQIPHYTFEHVRREKNTQADALANEALDQAYL